MTTKVEVIARPRRGSITWRDWVAPGLLVLLTVVPSIGGAIRLASLAGGEQVTPENARFFGAPVPVLIHIFSALPFCLLGAFQFSAGHRRRWPAWHRRVGRVLVLAGLAAGLSGLWMTNFYPMYPRFQDTLLYVFRLVFGSGMVVSIALAYAAIMRRDIPSHRAWMIRGYAIGQGAGTQAVTAIIWLIFLGEPDQMTREILLAVSWIINIALAEWIIRRNRARNRQGRRVASNAADWDSADAALEPAALSSTLEPGQK